jgi:hypothetical protein
VNRAPFVEWTLPRDRYPADGDVFAVKTITIREYDGIHYEVRVSLRSLDEHAFEEGESDLGVWTFFVPFGQTDATVAGGSAFVAAARRQEEVAEQWARRGL